VVGVFKAKAQELQVPSKLYKFLFYLLKKVNILVEIILIFKEFIEYENSKHV